MDGVPDGDMDGLEELGERDGAADGFDEAGFDDGELDGKPVGDPVAQFWVTASLKAKNLWLFDEAILSVAVTLRHTSVRVMEKVAVLVTTGVDASANVGANQFAGKEFSPGPSSATADHPVEPLPATKVHGLLRRFEVHRMMRPPFAGPAMVEKPRIARTVETTGSVNVTVFSRCHSFVNVPDW